MKSLSENRHDEVFVNGKLIDSIHWVEKYNKIEAQLIKELAKSNVSKQSGSEVTA